MDVRVQVIEAITDSVVAVEVRHACSGLCDTRKVYVYPDRVVIEMWHQGNRIGDHTVVFLGG